MTEVNEAPAGASRGGDGAEPLLRLRGIDKHFGPVQALYGVNLDLPAGQVTGLCGDNGAGKSVLTRTIAGAHSLTMARSGSRGSRCTSGRPGMPRRWGSRRC